ncbi:MAG: hypothetical protein LUD14_09015 [Clostridiales bacterium]|nr:hypothetical protein [Clostridiales bacterium]
MLTVTGRASLIATQRDMIEKRDQLEISQTNMNYDRDYYNAVGYVMQLLDEGAEVLRRVLDGEEVVE